MFIAPIGSNPPSDEDRQPIYQAINGELLTISTRLTLKDGTTPVTPANSRLTFALAETQFCEEPIWEGSWEDGITEVDNVNHPGLVIVTIPEDIGNSLRRGGYYFAISVRDMFGRNECVPVRGAINIEYATTSATHSIAYKDKED